MNTIQEKFARYEELKKIVTDAELEMEELKPAIIEAMPEGKTVEGTAGVFEVRSRTVWKFSANHKKKKDELKELEAEEKAKGIAEQTQSSALYYTTNTARENQEEAGVI